MARSPAKGNGSDRLAYNAISTPTRSPGGMATLRSIRICRCPIATAAAPAAARGTRRAGVMDASGVVAPKSFVLHYVGDLTPPGGSRIPFISSGKARIGESSPHMARESDLATAPALLRRALRTRSGVSILFRGRSWRGLGDPSQVSWPRYLESAHGRGAGGALRALLPAVLITISPI
jgi:hypothetical protein